MRLRHLHRVALLAGLFAASGNAWAGAGDPVGPSFRDAVEAAWARAPERDGLSAQQHAAEARAEAAGSAFPGSPTLAGTYDDDHLIGSNEGYTTYQGELSTPIWLPGEGTATVRAARADAHILEAQADNAHLTVAAEVLDATVEALLARGQLANARASLDVTRHLAHDVDHAAALGETPPADADAVRAQLEADSVLATDAATRAATAAAALQALTGSAAVPSLVWTGTPAVPVHADAPATRDAAEVASSDPRVAVAQRKLDAALAALRVVRVSPIADPELGVEVIRDKQFGSPWDSRVGVTLRIPLPSRARNLPRLAAAESDVTVAEAELLRVRRLVRLGVLQAQAQLDGAKADQASAIRAAIALDRRAGSVTRAWHVGEMPLIELLRARQAAFDAQAQRNRAEVTVQAAVLRAILARGVVP